MATYTGFSSKNFYLNGKDFSVRDEDLIKEDIINHIFTKKGERVNMPNWGTRIPEMAFEPLDDTTLEIIQTDLAEVIAYEKRVKLLKLLMVPDYDNNALMAQIVLEFYPSGTVDTLLLPIPIAV
jgi:phage baseplate assembly protein W